MKKPILYLLAGAILSLVAAMLWPAHAQQSIMGTPPVVSAPATAAAINFANKVNVTDPIARQDLVGFVNELQAVGISALNNNPNTTNLVDAMFLQPRFNPTTNLSWNGATMTMSNITFSPWGAAFSGNGLIKMPIADSRTNTFVIVWKGYSSNFDQPVQQWMGGLVNSDPTKQTAQWYYMFNQGLKYTFRETNTFFASLGGDSLICPWWYTTYDWSMIGDVWNQRTVTAATCTGIGGGGIYSFFHNGVPAKYGNTVTNYYLTNTAIVPANALNTILLGVDNLGPAGGYFGGYYNGEIGWAGVFNYPISTNQMVGIYRALRWLEPEKVNRVWWGDSQFSMNTSVNSNCTPQYFQDSGAHTNEVCWKNLSKSGVKVSQMWNATTSNMLYLDAPYGKVERTEHYIQGGINDFYGNGDSLNTVSNSLFTIIANDIGPLRVKPYVFTLMPVATNSNSAYTYAASTEAAIDGFNQIIITNSFLFAGVIRLDLLQGQSDLDRQLNTFSTDGLHLFGPTGYVLNRRIADVALGLEFPPIGNVVTLGNFPYTLKIGDYQARVTTASGNTTIKLPATPFDAEVHFIKKTSSDANTLTIDGNGHLIDGVSTKSTTVQNATFHVQYDLTSASWNIL